MTQIREEVKDYWNKKVLVLAFSHDKEIVAIGERLDKNAERYIHIRTKDFLDFADKITIANREVKKGMSCMTLPFMNEKLNVKGRILKPSAELIKKNCCLNCDKWIMEDIVLNCLCGSFCSKECFSNYHKCGKQKEKK